MPRAYNARILSICAFQARLALFHQLGLEGALPRASHLDDHMPLLAFERFLAMPIAAVAKCMALASMFWVAQVRVEFRFQAAFDHRTGRVL